MRVAIVGYGSQGTSAYGYWHAKGDEVTICDSREHIDVPQGALTQLGKDYLNNLDRFDVVVRAAPSIHPNALVAANSPDILTKVTSNTNEFFSVCPSRNIIGVTGTKGKGTTSTLIAQMLQAAGQTVHLGGNIGIPPLDLLQDTIRPDDWIVMELANFQLIDFTGRPRIAVCLMVVPEHLDWHTDMAEYMNAKSQLFARQTSTDTAIYYADNQNSTDIARTGAGHKLPYYRTPGAWVNGNMVTIDGKEVCTTDEIKLLGAHNWQNVCAAITAVWQTGVHDIPAMRSVLTSFSGLEYHLERIRELDGVTYYNDSFGTTPETAIVALQAFTEPKVLILGGSDKGVGFTELAREIKNSNVRHILLIGNTTNTDRPTVTPKLEKALRAAGVENITSLMKPGGAQMDEVLAQARNAAQPGDVVLFSTGCASFDMYANYKDRGKQFTTAVRSL